MKILSPSEYFEKIKKIFVRSDLTAIITIAMTMLLGNLIFLTSEGIAHDGLTNGYTYLAGAWEISLGRFLLPFMDTVRFEIVDKIVIFTLSVVFMIGTVLVLKRLFKIENKLQIFFFSFLFSITPFVIEILYYTFCADSYFLGLFLAALSIYFLSKKTKKHTVFAIILTVIYLALYQSLLGVALGLLIVYTIKRIFESENSKEVIKEFFLSAVTILVALVLYYICVHIACKIYGIELSSYQGADSVGINTILNIPTGIKKAIKDFISFYRNDNYIITNNVYRREIPYIILAITAAVMALMGIKNIKKNRLSRGAIVLALICILPIAINITDVISPASRYYLLTAIGNIAIIPFLFILWQNIPKTNINNILRIASTCCLIYLSWTFILSNNYTQVLKKHTYERFNNFAVDVLNRGTNLDNYKSGMQWTFSKELGSMAIDWDKSNGSVSSIGIAHDGYFGILRYDRYFSKYLGAEIPIAPEETYHELMETAEFKAMGIYPAKDSVRIINNVVVVKVSEDYYKN